MESFWVFLDALVELRLQFCVVFGRCHVALELALHRVEPFGVGHDAVEVVFHHLRHVALAAVEFGEVEGKNLFVLEQLATHFVGFDGLVVFGQVGKKRLPAG